MSLVLLGAVAGKLSLAMQETYSLRVLYRVWLPLGAGAARRLP